MDGVLYCDLPDYVWPRLDLFEGGMYQRGPVRVQTCDGVARDAATYIVRPEYAGLLEPHDWDFHQFLRRHVAEFQRIEYKRMLHSAIRCSGAKLKKVQKKKKKKMRFHP